MQKENSYVTNKVDLLSVVGIHNSSIVSTTLIVCFTVTPAHQKQNKTKRENMDFYNLQKFKILRK